MQIIYKTFGENFIRRTVQRVVATVHSKLQLFQAFTVRNMTELVDKQKRLYIVHCIDDQSCGMQEMGTRFGGSIKRLSVYAEHKAYQGETANPSSPTYIQKIAAGPMESDCGKFMIGSCFILYATKEEVERFNTEDPFYAAGVWEKISINRYISIPNGIKPVVMEKDGDDMTTIRMVPS